MDGDSQGQSEFAANCAQLWASLSTSQTRALLALLVLCLAVYLPGVMRLPAVDRTEVVYAETTRDMLARGQWLDPRYGETIHQFRPIGPYWVQGVAAKLAGPELARDITVYRLPGLIAVSLSVLALFWLSAPLVGIEAALIASGLFAVAPLTVLLAQLAIGESLSLLPATVAMLALLRIYVAERAADTRRLAFMFWAALGAGMFLNALLVPILVLVTLIALRFIDRDMWWLDRLHTAWGLPLALAISSPWLIVRAHQDGVPYAGMGWGDFIDALSGSQDMKLKAWPGTFLLAMFLGFLPGTVLMIPAIKRLWETRADKLARFLFAWIVGHIVYLELLSSKPGTYSVQVMYPALAIAVALMITKSGTLRSLPKWHLIPWPPLAALFAIVLLAAPYVAGSQFPGVIALLLIAAVAYLFFISAREGHSKTFKNWALTGIAALALFAVTLLALVLPSINVAWPARQFERALHACPTAAIAVLGWREPSSYFKLRVDRSLQTPEAIAAKKPGVAVIESRWLERYRAALGANNQMMPPVRGCVPAYNITRGCSLAFAIFAKDEAGCKVPEEFACKNAPIPPPSMSRNCD